MLSLSLSLICTHAFPLHTTTGHAPVPVGMDVATDEVAFHVIEKGAVSRDRKKGPAM